MLLDTGTNDIMLFKPCLRGGLQQLPVQGKDFNRNAGGRDSLAPPRGFIGNSQMESGGLNTPKHQLSGNFLSRKVLHCALRVDRAKWLCGAGALAREHIRTPIH
jgi:hypothetical protein